MHIKFRQDVSTQALALASEVVALTPSLNKSGDDVDDSYCLLENVAISDALSLKAARRDAIAKSFVGFAIATPRTYTGQIPFLPPNRPELPRSPMPFHLNSLCGATLMPLAACTKTWQCSRIPRVGKNSGPIYRRLWTKVGEILGQ